MKFSIVTQDLHLEGFAFVLSHHIKKPVLVLCEENLISKPVRDLSLQSVTLEEILDTALICHTKLDYMVLEDLVLIHDSSLFAYTSIPQAWELELAYTTDDMGGDLETTALNILLFLSRRFKKTILAPTDSLKLQAPIPFFLKRSEGMASLLFRLSQLAGFTYSSFENMLSIKPQAQKILPKAPTVMAIL
ncbi:MAG: hypothetical protein H3C47_05555 [Candidatus Cloacimonetes bacterium]|nr:hypothetical protein [Candidatus Cloacimonadota bacterium]